MMRARAMLPMGVVMVLRAAMALLRVWRQPRPHKGAQLLPMLRCRTCPAHAALPTRRRDAVRHLLHTHRFRESFRLGTPPPVRNSALAGLQAALATALCVPLFLCSPWAHLVGFASLGALVALFGRFAPRRSRTGIVLQCAFWQTFAVFAMSATAWLDWPPAAQLVLLAASCGFYLLICFRHRFGAPGPLLFIFAVGAAMTKPSM